MLSVSPFNFRILTCLFLVPDGSSILNINRLDNMFTNVTKRNEFNALSDTKKIFCTSLLKQSCRYLDRTFPGGQIVGYENGKWNALGWLNACMAVAASDRSIGCWPVNKNFERGRPVIKCGSSK
jgi:hypothetical protein